MLEPEAILNTKLDKNELKYLVKWKGKHRSSATWVKASTLEDSAQTLIDAFFEQKQKELRYDNRVKPFTRSTIRIMTVNNNELVLADNNEVNGESSTDGVIDRDNEHS